MKVPFYLLGLLMRYGPQHGYSLKQMISRDIANFAEIKLPTMYYHLEKMAEEGYLTANLDREGNRPEKTTYAITGKGREYFRLLTQHIFREAYESESNLDGILFFSDTIERDVLIAALITRRNTINKRYLFLRSRDQTLVEEAAGNAQILSELIFHHQLYHFEVEIDWLDEVIAVISQNHTRD